MFLTLVGPVLWNHFLTYALQRDARSLRTATRKRRPLRRRSRQRPPFHPEKTPRESRFHRSAGRVFFANITTARQLKSKVPRQPLPNTSHSRDPSLPALKQKRKPKMIQQPNPPSCLPRPDRRRSKIPLRQNQKIPNHPRRRLLLPKNKLPPRRSRLQHRISPSEVVPEPDQSPSQHPSQLRRRRRIVPRSKLLLTRTALKTMKTHSWRMMRMAMISSPPMPRAATRERTTTTWRRKAKKSSCPSPSESHLEAERSSRRSRRLKTRMRKM